MMLFQIGGRLYRPPSPVLKKDQAETFTEYLNTIDNDIKWTTEGEVHQEVEVEDMEKKVERCLAFLDTFVSDQRRRYYLYKSVQEGDPHRPVFELRQQSPPGAQTRCSENIYPQGKIHSEWSRRKKERIRTRERHWDTTVTPAGCWQRQRKRSRRRRERKRKRQW